MAPRGWKTLGLFGFGIGATVFLFSRSQFDQRQLSQQGNPIELASPPDDEMRTPERAVEPIVQDPVLSPRKEFPNTNESPPSNPVVSRSKVPLTDLSYANTKALSEPRKTLSRATVRKGFGPSENVAPPGCYVGVAQLNPDEGSKFYFRLWLPAIGKAQSSEAPATGWNLDNSAYLEVTDPDGNRDVETASESARFLRVYETPVNGFFFTMGDDFIFQAFPRMKTANRPFGYFGNVYNAHRIVDGHTEKEVRLTYQIELSLTSQDQCQRVSQ